MPLPDDLIRVVHALSFCRDQETLMRVLRRSVRELTRADGATVVLREGDLCHYVDEDAIAPLWKGKRFPMSVCISGWCMTHRQQVAIRDIYADGRIPHDAYRPTFVKSLAMTPIRATEPIGAIGAYWATNHRATPDQLELLRALGEAASTAVANVQLFQQLEEANRRKDEFLLMLAHELRNPLAPIRNAVHLLKARTGDDPPANRVHEVIERQIGHLGRIVDDLLDVSRIARGALEVRTERVDLGRVVAEAVEDHRATLEAGGLEVAVAVPELPVWVAGDAVRLAQVVASLLDNARKFTPSGDVLVRVEPDPEQGHAALTVRDTGIGIAPEMLRQLFDPFTQADRSLDRASGGLGLGLALARGLVELHGGTITAASDGVGRGATFTVQLPLEAEPAALAGGPPEQSPARGCRVLVVEDNRDAAETLRMVLELSGFDAHVAYTGTDGLEAAKALGAQIVVSDIGLPGMDGYALARALRADPTTAAVHLIAVTGYGSDDDRRRALGAGFDLHLVKPVPPSRLIQELSAVAPVG